MATSLDKLENKVQIHHLHIKRSHRVKTMQVVSVGVHDIFQKSIDCHGNVPRQIGKQGKDVSSALKALSYGEKIVKIGTLYPQIFD